MQLLPKTLPGVLIAAVAGCAAAPDLNSDLQLSGHGAAAQTSSQDGRLTDSSATPHDVAITVRRAEGVPQDLSLTMAGTMERGGTIAPISNLRATQPSELGGPVPDTETDTFLVQVQGAGNHHSRLMLVRGVFDAEGQRIGGVRGYLAVGERTGAMPTTGRTAYRGEADIGLVSDGQGIFTATGRTELTADFAPSGGTIEGRISDVAVSYTPQPAFRYDIRLNPTAIANGGFHGSVSLVQPGSDNVTLETASSFYRGEFYGPGAAEAAGAFRAKAATPIVPELTGAPREIMGSFGGAAN